MAINFPTSPSVNDIHTSGDMSWKWDGTTWKATIATSVPIPSQSGQAGEYLQTDGTNMTWEAVDALPSQTGQAGEYLKTDGTTATWEPAGGGYDVATTSTGYFDLPAGTTAQRPGSPATGMIRLNTDNDALEHYADGTWIGFAGSTPTISGIGPTTAAETGTTITVTGTNFQAGAVVKLIGTNATQVNAASTTVNSSTEIQFTTPALLVANEPYDVKVVNTNGGSATLSDILDAGGLPSWTTAAGSLGNIDDDATGTHFTLVATDPDGTAITFAETTSALTGAGLSLNSTTGAISGDPTDVSSLTTYNFDVDASDSVNTTSRSFSIIVNPILDGSTQTKAAQYGSEIVALGSFSAGLYWLKGKSSLGLTAQQVYVDTGGYMLVYRHAGTGGSYNSTYEIVGDNLGEAAVGTLTSPTMGLTTTGVSTTAGSRGLARLSAQFCNALGGDSASGQITRITVNNTTHYITDAKIWWTADSADGYGHENISAGTSYSGRRDNTNVTPDVDRPIGTYNVMTNSLISFFQGQGYSGGYEQDGGGWHHATTIWVRQY